MPTVSQILSARVAAALDRAAREEGWQGQPAEIEIEQPANPQHGDYATGVAMRSARTLRRAPQEIAEATVRRLPPDDVIASAEVAGKGFVNLRLRPEWVARQAAEIALPAEGYQGEYVTDIARAIIAREGDRYRTMTIEEQARTFAPIGVDWVVRDDERVCEKFGIKFDHWFSQAEMMRSSYFEDTVR